MQNLLNEEGIKLNEYDIDALLDCIDLLKENNILFKTEIGDNLFYFCVVLLEKLGFVIWQLDGEQEQIIPILEEDTESRKL